MSTAELPSPAELPRGAAQAHGADEASPAIDVASGPRMLRPNGARKVVGQPDPIDDPAAQAGFVPPVDEDDDWL